MKQQQQVTCEGYILRCRPYLETAWLVDLFTPERGLFGAITTASKRQGKIGAKRSKPQFFQPHLLRLKMRPGLAGLNEYTQQKLQGLLRGYSLYAALYINELLFRLLPHYDPHPKLYNAYRKTLLALLEDDDFEPWLRNFEHILLQELGAGITWDVEARTREPIEAGYGYYFLADEGFVLATKHDFVADQGPPSSASISGAHIIAVAARDYQSQATRQVAKTIMRSALAPLLGDRPLGSRALFADLPAFQQKAKQKAKHRADHHNLRT